uniref:Secreted protein n=1 Tax=Arundo donax TaxID=35708 RepID=A0A0A9CPX4_ARUDO
MFFPNCVCGALFLEFFSFSPFVTCFSVAASLPLLDEEGDTSDRPSKPSPCPEPPSSTALTSSIATESRCTSRVISTTSSSSLNRVVLVPLRVESSKLPLCGINVAVSSCDLLELPRSVAASVPAIFFSTSQANCSLLLNASRDFSRRLELRACL